MGSIVLAEKPDQAQLYRDAIGTRFGPILAARGHLFELAEPQDVNPSWKTWSVGLLRPEKGFYPTRLKADVDLKRRFKAIADAARNATTIYVATDPDREGEGIGTDIVNALRRDHRWEGRVLRVLPLATDPTSLQQAFAAARPGEEFRSLYQSYVARQQSDQIWNLSLTRTASCLFRPEGWNGPLSVGRVLTPTMGIVVRREREIKAFVPVDYFEPWVDAVGAAGRVKLTHSPPVAERILDRAVAERLASAAQGYKGPIHVRCERKKQGPPPLFSLAKLQTEASRRFRWPVAKTTDALQSLYEAKAVTYPRSEETSLPESEIENAPAMLAGLLRVSGIGPVSWSGRGPVIRRQKGAFSDAALKGAAHYAIVPNINTVSEWGAIAARMSPDERRLFDLIARRYLAAIGPDRVYDRTRMWITVDDREFARVGIVEVVPGWREAGERPGAIAGEDDDEETRTLPAFTDGAPVSVSGSGVAAKQTEPPQRFTDATLVIAMIEAWKEVPDQELRAVLRGTNGIGTPATQSLVVANLLQRGYIAPVDKAGGPLRATEAGLELYDIFQKAAPTLLDVGQTGRMEMMLERIKSGDVKAAVVVNEIVAIAQEAVGGLVAAKEAGAGVTAAQQKPAARSAGRTKRGAGKSGAARDEKVVSDPSSIPTGEERAPSDKALDFARRLASERKVTIPPEVAASAHRLSAWIDAHKQGSPTSKAAEPAEPRDDRPSSKQVSFAEKIAQRRRVEVPDECFRSRELMSRWIETNSR